MKNKILLVGGVVIILALAAGLAYNKLHLKQDTIVTTADDGVDTTDVTLAFYNTWLDAKRSTSTTVAAVLSNTTALTDDLKNKLKTQVNNTPDPVLCLATVPPRIGTKKIFQSTTTAQNIVLGRGMGTTSASNAIVSLIHTTDGWKINDITCGNGEMAPKSDFSFEQRGALLKSVPKPLDPKYWYLVFEENHEQGHFAALTFTASSSCTYTDNTTAPCDVSKFNETQEALVQGDATETGVNVRLMKLY
jgi:hypothetical protein